MSAVDREQHEFDTIVIGSGFGGSVTTATLAAEHHERVCLLERGRPYPPGSFQREPYGFGRSFWDPSEGNYGLFQVWRFNKLNAVVSSGLGGGSLIYANVIIRKDEHWFDRKVWPVGRTDLDPHYDEVEKVLKPTPYPFERAPYRDTVKTKAFHEAAINAGFKPFLPKLAVSFGDYPSQELPDSRDNYHQAARTSCRLCGECDVGCNTGSKNSLDFNYLSMAKRDRAEIRPSCEVRSIGRIAGGYRVSYVEHDEKRDEGVPRNEPLALHHVTARRVVLAAGTLGSTYLLLENRAALGLHNAMLGQRFSGNGDTYTFIKGATANQQGKVVPRRIYDHGAPVITSAIRVSDVSDGDGAQGRGHYVEDGGVPEWVSWVTELLSPDFRRVFHLARGFLKAKLLRDPDLSSELAGVFGDTRSSTTQLPLLGMGLDVADGVFRLEAGKRGGRSRLQLDWKKLGSSAYYDGIEVTLRKLAKGIQGRHAENPLTRFFSMYFTAHPLGGCPMGADASRGVVDPWGQVFGCENLYVADGSVLPGPVGGNPSFTIAALAHRFASRMLEEDRRRGLLPLAPLPVAPGQAAAAP
ncbi:MAG: FAD-dependent oxidoreductase [Myxococcaceae bacterium]|nr:FAD-dependent oxidoreductase [Myxococcaceae bacterium]